MNKRKIFGLTLGLIMLSVISACGKFDQLEGKWQAQDGSGKTVELEFTKDKVTVDGQVSDYVQEGTGNKNGTPYVYIRQSGEPYTIAFPDKKDKNLAIMIAPTDEKERLDGSLLYAMHREEQPDYDVYAEKFGK